MLTVHHISKNYGIQPVLHDISFSLNRDDRVALIGPNGGGKTTLLRIIAGQETPDSGSVSSTLSNLRIGYLSQGAQFSEDATIESFMGLGAPATRDLEAEIARLASALSLSPNDFEIHTQYDQAIRRLAMSARPTTDPLIALGLANIPNDTPVKHLSGGQKTRLMLAQAILVEPDLLLLDEPTNHLDIGTLEWLESWLAGFSGAALIVSHDRAFLDNTVSRVFDLDPTSHSVIEYQGNYSDYLSHYGKLRDKQLAAYRDQVVEIRRLKQDIARTKEQARHVEITTTPRQPGVRRIAKKVAAKAKSREHKLERYLGSDERVERPRPSWQLKLEFSAPATTSQRVLTAEELTVGYASAPAVLRDVSFSLRAGERIAMTGPNGAGKTTLLRTIAGKLPPLAGSVRIGASVKLGYMAQEQELLDQSASALDTVLGVASFGETEARNFLHFFLFEDDAPLRPAKSLSYGERARLQLAVLVAQASTFLLLDEPINHLDIPSRERFELALGNFEGTVLAVVHDRYFIQRFASSVWTVEDGKVRIW